MTPHPETVLFVHRIVEEYANEFIRYNNGHELEVEEGALVIGSREGFFEVSDAHRWELTVLNYHRIMVTYPYSFLVVITKLLSCIIFINDYICIVTGSPG